MNGKINWPSQQSQDGNKSLITQYKIRRSGFANIVTEYIKGFLQQQQPEPPHTNQDQIPPQNPEPRLLD